MSLDHVAGVVPELRSEIQRSEESRYSHRLHGVLLVAQGMSCREAARLLGAAPRAVQYWVRSFKDRGLAGLQEGRPSGRPRRLSGKQVERLRGALKKQPEEFGLASDSWDGKTLSEYLHRRHGVLLGVRQCQRLLRALAPSTV